MMDRIRVRFWVMVLVALLAACDPAPEVTLPTRVAIVIPTETATLTPSETPAPMPSAVVTPTASLTLTLTPSVTFTPSITFTPSMTITDTPTRTFTATLTPTEALSALSLLIDQMQRATVLPRLTPLPTSNVFIPPTAPGGFIATPLPSTQCQYLPPGGFGLIFLNQPALVEEIGCPVGAPPVTVSVSSASQLFERGVMLWANEIQSTIYVFDNTGAFSSFPDTFDPTLDPESGNQAPPAGLIEPIRGFGKVWRTFEGVRSALGWAIGGEAGGTAVILQFTNGKMISDSMRGDILILVYQGSPSLGVWRSVAGQF